MGETELKIALQQEGDARIRAFWEEAEGTVEKRRREIDAHLEQLRDENDRRLQAELADLRSDLLFEAQIQAMACRLRAEAAVEERLLALARAMLGDLSGDARTAHWSALAAELPAGAWANVRVAPPDQALAEQAFADAAIVCDEMIVAGLVVGDAKGRVTIDNSLPCRLRRAWPDLLPKLMADLRKQVDDNEAAVTDPPR